MWNSIKLITKCLCISTLCLSHFVMAESVKNFDQAMDMIIDSVKKNKLTNLDIECLMFVYSLETETDYYIDVREKHNKRCGGDPNIAPRLFTYVVNKEKGTIELDENLSTMPQKIE